MQLVALAAICGCALLGALLSMSGLFGLDLDVLQINLTPSESPKNTAAHTTESPLPRAFDRLVFVVIDALRADMVLGNEAIQHHGGEDLSAFMPYTSTLARSDQSIAYVAKAAVPTVTMPRLKALTTGKKPAFIDVLRNFNSKALEGDNIMTLFQQAGFRMVLYGDETWLDLFPGLFSRHDATSGFFARDTVEVDTNVTRHLAEELDPTMESPKSRDWDLLLLHYLGVDHVGHMQGPHSRRMKEKLGEMDSVIQSIHKSIQEQDKIRSPSALPTLFVLCSDHGMTETGSHGGASIEESSSLLLFAVPQPQTSSYKSALQVDLVPTLASLFGLDIPSSNTGKVLVDVLKSTTSAFVDAMHRNLDQLRSLAARKWSPAESLAFDKAYTSLSVESALQLLQDAVLKSDGSEYNLLAIGMGILSTAFGLGLAVWKLPPVRPTPLHLAVGLGTVVHIASYGSSSAIENEHATWNFLLSTLWMLLCLRHVAAKDFRSTAWLIAVAIPTRIMRSRNQVINFARLNSLPPIGTDNLPGYEYETDDSLSIITTRSLLDGVVSPELETFGAIAIIAIYGILKAQSTAGLHRVAVQVLYAAGMISVVCFAIFPLEPTYAHAAYASSIILLVLGIVLKSMHGLPLELAAWILCCLLQRPSNLSMCAVLSIQQAFFYKWAQATKADAWIRTVDGLWMSKCGFYALGNSHLMTTIDITNAYVGLTVYSQGIVGFLTFFIVMTAPTVVLLSTLSPGQPVQGSLAVLWALELTSFLVYSVIMYAMRFHLFIWSVFAPKMMYHIAFLLWNIAITCVLVACG
ncbi:hypothetical protein LEN26_013555 [Aphanomyces euteiches]|nr:hypothetical protein AeMF1_015508 [Aphanomyces euteiches]KAH9111087.1 hypothetical protein LEN26_013555 [Aphanomyces euteiches]KAH9193945.1 hypothetical protein AeNC1_004075 [Aphanomyces euteiches]